MPIYDRPTKTLMTEWANEHLRPGQFFGKPEPAAWFRNHYPDIKRNTVNMHVDAMSVNNHVRRHHPSIKPGSGHDLFFKEGPDRFRLWNKGTDPNPLYKKDIEEMEHREEADDEEKSPSLGASEFAFEKDLQNYLAKNLEHIEAGLKLYEEEEITGLEFPAGGRFIDILAVDKTGGLVVIELKVSRGYDRVIGQLLRYMGWVSENMDTPQPVRGIIVANTITNDLKLAASKLADVSLVEYELSFRLRTV